MDPTIPVNAGTHVIDQAAAFGPVVYLAIISVLIMFCTMVFFIWQSGRREERIASESARREERLAAESYAREERMSTVVANNTQVVAGIVPTLTALAADVKRHDDHVVEIEDKIDMLGVTTEKVNVRTMRIEEMLKPKSVGKAEKLM